MQRFDPIRSVMCFGAHPDDETIMAGGTLAMLHAQGVRTHIITATDGRGGEGASNQDDLARIRIAELAHAAEALGATSLMVMRYLDPAIGPNEELYPFASDEDELVAQIGDLIWVRRPDVVLTHGTDGEYGHPAHQQLHRAVLQAVREHVPDTLVYTFAAHLPGSEDRLWNASDPAHLALDITPWAEAKHNAMLAHRSQHDLFKRRRKLKTVREALRAVESFRRQWPVFEGGEPDDAFMELMLGVGAYRPVHAAAEKPAADAAPAG